MPGSPPVHRVTSASHRFANSCALESAGSEALRRVPAVRYRTRLLRFLLQDLFLGDAGLVQRLNQVRDALEGGASPEGVFWSELYHSFETHLLYALGSFLPKHMLKASRTPEQYVLPRLRIAQHRSDGAVEEFTAGIDRLGLRQLDQRLFHVTVPGGPVVAEQPQHEMIPTQSVPEFPRVGRPKVGLNEVAPSPFEQLGVARD